MFPQFFPDSPILDIAQKTAGKQFWREGRKRKKTLGCLRSTNILSKNGGRLSVVLPNKLDENASGLM